MMRQMAFAVLMRQMVRASSSAADRVCSAAQGPQAYKLLEKWKTSPDSWVLRFALPSPMIRLAADPSLPTCIKVTFNGTDEAGAPKQLSRSYSPVSLPATEATVDLLVKAYRPGGGGAHLCGLGPGDIMTAEVKAERMMHGSAAVARRWKHIGLVGGGTGVAPLIQVARIVLADAADATRVSMLCVHRRREDILMRRELDELAAAHPERFVVTHALTKPDEAWDGPVGRGSVELARAALPAPAGDGSVMVLVCGTDGFVATWGGPIGRGPPKPDGSKGPKVQGPLLGLLADAGFDASEVFKY